MAKNNADDDGKNKRVMLKELCKFLEVAVLMKMETSLRIIATLDKEGCDRN